MWGYSCQSRCRCPPVRGAEQPAPAPYCPTEGEGRPLYPRDCPSRRAAGSGVWVRICRCTGGERGGQGAWRGALGTGCTLEAPCSPGGDETGLCTSRGAVGGELQGAGEGTARLETRTDPSAGWIWGEALGMGLCAAAYGRVGSHSGGRGTAGTEGRGYGTCSCEEGAGEAGTLLGVRGELGPEGEGEGVSLQGNQSDRGEGEGAGSTRCCARGVGEPTAGPAWPRRQRSGPAGGGAWGWGSGEVEAYQDATSVAATFLANFIQYYVNN